MSGGRSSTAPQHNINLSAGQKSTLGHTPQMGWNSWNAFKANINESVAVQSAQLLATLGLKDAGYDYVLVDDGWADYNRTADGYLQANETSFPSGIPALADKIHTQGLKLGLYGDSGMLTCAFRPGSWGYEERDAQTLADWGVDYWKYDNCGGYQAMTAAPQVRFGIMQKALQLVGREILYSVCEWGYQFPWHWGGEIGHSYRMSGDITNVFANETSCPCKTAYCLNTGYASCSVMSIIRKMREISQYQSRGHWMDMDMLEIGNAEMTLYQQQTHFAFWAALKSPLIIGADLSKLSDDALKVLTNKQIISINQDPLGQPVNYVQNASSEGSSQVWAGSVENGYVVLLLNEKSYPQELKVDFETLGLQLSISVNVTELWTRRSLGKIGSFSGTLQAYQTLVFRLYM
ncbi:glycoside hydrolase family 27 protein [Aspergillus aculeatinus CBS 121060]|uniref:Alpha-galactosidase/alpha-n-acetylgalactosaminidase n=1 Tax=Aspergillus aculeatinus CBS 121060 TaxID=1448322 RepID=A0ACD1HBX8_9EURO|nr:alpha-galactosidase/alpha-n-acetylgalactosaminidase [Aspergillus aculeatinus CBS 121060]RAH71317.1 alpha-galactosidase/alpha-n-acetylgalactosaminidase [Aspergillus aculeatinus CBS 121060]